MEKIKEKLKNFKLSVDKIKLVCAGYSLIVGILLLFLTTSVIMTIGALVLLLIGAVLIAQVAFKHIKLPYEIINIILLMVFGFVIIFERPTLLVFTYILFMQIELFNRLYKEKQKDVSNEKSEEEKVENTEG